jgi:hypothetical protein
MTGHQDLKEAKAAKLAATLPDAREALLALAWESVEQYHASILAHDQVQAAVASELNEAVIWKLNGSMFFGCMDSENPEAGGILVRDHCKTAPGNVPLWGQTGEFLIEVEGIRAVVEVTDGFGDGLWPNFGFHAVDTKSDFISETGYRSAMPCPSYGKGVDEFACGHFMDLLKEKRRPLTPEYREESSLEAWEWLNPTPMVPADRCHEEDGGQLAFGF